MGGRLAIGEAGYKIDTKLSQKSLLKDNIVDYWEKDYFEMDYLKSHFNQKVPQPTEALPILTI